MAHTVTVLPVLTDLSLCEEDIPLLTAEACLPQITGRDSRRFERYYRACAAAFESWCRHKVFPQTQQLYRQALRNAAPLPQWHASLQTEITFRQKDVLSLYTEIRLTGAPQRTVIRRADTWDLRRGLPMTAAEFFPPHTLRRVLLLEAAQQIRQQEAQGIAAYDPQWSQKLRHAFRPHRFYLTEQGLCFFFPACTIAPAAEGIPTFCLPYNEETGPYPPK